jgi:ubiquinol-cytochrome c reductase cytochrome b subunit
VVAHIIALHEVGSNNPDGVEIKALKDDKGIPLDGIPFHPYYTVHDILGVSVFLMAFSAVIFFAPEFGGFFLEYNNFIPADPLVTPLHIAPVWYFTPFYSMLRAVTGQFMYPLMAAVALGVLFAVLKSSLSAVMKGVMAGGAAALIAMMLSIDPKFWGVVIMGSGVMILFFLPWLDYSPVRSIRYRPSWNKWLYGAFVINFFLLGYLGIQPPGVWGVAAGQDLAERTSQIGTLFYFGFFLLMPWWSRLGEFKTVPTRVVFQPH